MMFDKEWHNFMSEDMAWMNQGAMVPWGNEYSEEAFLKRCRGVGIQ